MAKLRYLNDKGDQKLAEWNPAQIKAGDPEALAAVEEAEAILQEKLSKGDLALLQRVPGEPAERIHHINPTEEGEVILVPRQVGG